MPCRHMLGFAICIIATFPRNCDANNTNKLIPITEEGDLNGTSPTIIFHNDFGIPVLSTFATTINVPKKISSSV